MEDGEGYNDYGGGGWAVPIQIHNGEPTELLKWVMNNGPWSFENHILLLRQWEK